MFAYPLAMFVVSGALLLIRILLVPPQTLTFVKELSVWTSRLVLGVGITGSIANRTFRNWKERLNDTLAKSQEKEDFHKESPNG